MGRSQDTTAAPASASLSPSHLSTWATNPSQNAAREAGHRSIRPQRNLPSLRRRRSQSLTLHRQSQSQQSRKTRCLAGLKEPKEGVWAGGNSDWAIGAPWTTNKGSPFGAPGGGKTAPTQPVANPAAKFPVPAEVMMEEIPAAMHKVAKPEA